MALASAVDTIGGVLGPDSDGPQQHQHKRQAHLGRPAAEPTPGPERGANGASLHLQITPEAHINRRPQVNRWIAEIRAVAGNGGAVEQLEVLALLCTATGGLMVQRPAEHPGAEVIPVGIAVEQMQMPDLIDLIRGRDQMICHHGQEDELFILLHGPHSKTLIPAIATHQMIDKTDCIGGVAQLVLTKTSIKLLLLCQHNDKAGWCINSVGR